MCKDFREEVIHGKTLSNAYPLGIWSPRVQQSLNL